MLDRYEARRTTAYGAILQNAGGRKHGISDAFCSWRSKFGGLDGSVAKRLKVGAENR